MLFYLYFEYDFIINKYKFNFLLVIFLRITAGGPNRMQARCEVKSTRSVINYRTCLMGGLIRRT